MANYLFISIYSPIFAVLLLTIVIFPVNSLENTEAAMNTNKDKCEYQSVDGYYKRVDHMCCKNKRINNTINLNKYQLFETEGPHSPLETNTNCSESTKEVDSDDIATSLYRRYLCILKLEGATAQDLSTFQNYLGFMTKNYEESTKSSFLNNAGKCGDADKEADELKRLIAMDFCFSQAVEELCKIPINRTTPVKFKSQQEYCQNNHRYACCKGTLMPPMGHVGFDHYYHTEIKQMRICGEAFEKRRKELESIQKNSTSTTEATVSNFMYRPSQYSVACTVRVDHFDAKSSLSFNLDEVKMKMFTVFPKSARQELLERFDKYASGSIYKLPNSNSTVTLKEAVKWMDRLDQLSYMEVYSRLYSYLFRNLSEMSFTEYCSGRNASTIDMDRLRPNLFDFQKSSKSKSIRTFN